MKILPDWRNSRETVAVAGSGREQLTVFVTDEDSERTMRQTITEMALASSSVSRGGIDKAIQHLQTARSPSALIVDLTGSEMPVNDVHRLAEVCEPGVAVTIVGDRNDVGLYRDLLRAGITDYLVKPLTRSLAQHAIGVLMGEEATASEPMSRKLGHIVGVIGARGGVGTTTVTANLAWLLANEQYRRVIVVDLDLCFGDCALMFDVKAPGGLRDVLDNPHRVDDLFLERAMTKHGERLHLLVGSDSLDVPPPTDLDSVSSLLRMLQNQFHYVIVDLPRRDNGLIRQVLDLASTRIVVTDLTAHGIRDTVKLRKILDAPRAGQRNLVVMNRAGEVAKQGIDEKFLADTIGIPVDVIVPYDPKGVISSVNEGAVAAAKKHKSTPAFQRLTAELTGRKQDAKKRWTGMLKKS